MMREYLAATKSSEQEENEQVNSASYLIEESASRGRTPISSVSGRVESPDEHTKKKSLEPPAKRS